MTVSTESIDGTAIDSSQTVSGLSVDDQQRILEESLHVVRVQAYHMKRCIDASKLMDAIKHCSTMLAELRTNHLTPRNYYELYMAIFDELQHLTAFIYEAHMNKKHHLSDLYELVQYAGNIVPRLYLMITVGSVYMRVSKELLPQQGISSSNSPTFKSIKNSSVDISSNEPEVLDKSGVDNSNTAIDTKKTEISNKKEEEETKNEIASDEKTNKTKTDNEDEMKDDQNNENQNDEKKKNAITDSAKINNETQPLTDTTNVVATGSRIEEVDDVPPIKELMQDMLEMTRGVQHPIRGLFLRYFLSTMTRDYLPDGLIEGPHGNINDSIQFVLQNFIEMNKLWVRLQHQGHSRDRLKREKERKDLRLLVGSNLVRLSQLEALTLNMYKTIIIPNILSEIVTCKDTIAQEYLMEVIVQVFQDELHLRTLDTFLQATAQLQPTVNVKQIVISLIDRFANFAARTRDEALSGDNKFLQDFGDDINTFNGIPEDVPLFDIFWEQITNLVETRAELTIEDISALMSSLCNLSLNCYIDSLDNIDKILYFVKEKYTVALKEKSIGYRNRNTILTIYQLLLAPVNAYASDILTFLKFPSSASNTNDTNLSYIGTFANNEEEELVKPTSVSLGGFYSDLLFMQPFSTRRNIAHTIAKIALKSHTDLNYTINSNDGVNLIFGELCSVLVRDHKDGGLYGAKPKVKSVDGFGKVDNENNEELQIGDISGYDNDEDDLLIDWDDILAEQNLVSKLVQLWKVDDEIVDAVLDVERAKNSEPILKKNVSDKSTTGSDSEKSNVSDEEDEDNKNKENKGSGLKKHTLEYPIVKTSIPSGKDGLDEYGNQLYWTPHLIFDTEYVLLVTARKHFGDGGSLRMRFSLPALVLSCIKLVKKLGNIHIINEDDLLAEKFVALFKFVHQAITSLLEAEGGNQDVDDVLTLFGDELPEKKQIVEHKGLMATPEICLRLFLDAARVSSDCGFEELAYEFFVQAFNTYEHSISNSGAQNVALTLIISALYSTTVFGYENYETLVSKAVVHCSRLVKRMDQCRSIVMASYLFWGDDRKARDGDKPLYRDGRKVLECLQKALKVADSTIDRTINVELFIEILESYNWYFESRNEAINSTYITSLLDLVKTNLKALEQDMERSLSTNDGIETHEAPDKIAASGIGAVSIKASTHTINSSKQAQEIMKRVIQHFVNTNKFVENKDYIARTNNKTAYYGF